MVALAVAAVSKIFGALGLSSAATAASTAAASTVAVAGPAGAATLVPAAATTAAGFSGGQILTTLLSAVGTIGAGLSSAQASRDQADQAELTAGQEQVAGQQRQLQMKRALLQTLGENDVAYAAAGIDISGGIAQSTAAEAKKRAASELSIDREDSDFRSALYRMRARGLRRQAGSQVGGALISALGGIANAGIDLDYRGV
jgi:hypothetical protein